MTSKAGTGGPTSETGGEAPTREELEQTLNEALLAWIEARSRLDECEIEVDVARTVRDGRTLREELTKMNVLKKGLRDASKALDRATANLAYFMEPKEDVPRNSGIARFMKWCCYKR